MSPLSNFPFTDPLLCWLTKNLQLSSLYSEWTLISLLYCSSLDIYSRRHVGSAAQSGLCYPLEARSQEAQSLKRQGLAVMGMAVLLAPKGCWFMEVTSVDHREVYAIGRRFPSFAFPERRGHAMPAPGKNQVWVRRRAGISRRPKRQPLLGGPQKRQGMAG